MITKTQTARACNLYLARINFKSMAYPMGERQERHPTFLHPYGLSDDSEPFVTPFGLELPGIISSRQELLELIAYIKNPQAELFKPHDLLPTLKHLGRIALNLHTGCWELPVYRDGEDRYPNGKRRARYAVMNVKSAVPNENMAHRVMFIIMRGDIQEGLVLDHLCENKKCCYHRHLEPVTVKENGTRIQLARKMIRGQMNIHDIEISGEEIIELNS